MPLRLRHPIKKRRAPPGKPQPYPVPLASYTGLPSSNVVWSYYEGELQGETIIIKNIQEANALYFKGFFGRWPGARKKFRKNEKDSSNTYSASGINDTKQDETNITSNEEVKIETSQELKNNHSSNSDDIIVINNSSSDDEEDVYLSEPSTSASPGEILSPDIKRLYLSLEEGFFLMYALGCLIIISDKKKLTVEEMWTICCERQPIFPYSYVAYHYFRSKGWVVRQELKYGSDFLLYKYGPPYYHSSYSVILQSTTTSAIESSDLFRKLSWTSLSGLNRITEHVAKEMMLCYVLPPADMVPSALNCPSCIPMFKVQEVVIRRWISAQERESNDIIS